MRSTIALAAALAVALSASAAFAGGKKEPADPRTNLIGLQKKSKGGWQNWCDVDPNCNGWSQWLQAQGKKS